MAKDPFANLPPIEPEDVVDQVDHTAPDHVGAPSDISAGSPPRTLLKSAQKWVVPAMGVAVAIWFFMPADQAASRKATQGPAEVDLSRQTAESEATIKGLKEEAAKKPVVVLPVMPGSGATSSASLPVTNSPVTTMPSGYGGSLGASGSPASSLPQAQNSPTRAPLPGYQGAAAPTGTPQMPTPIAPIDKEAAERAAHAYAAAVARQEEIRASAIEVTKVKLIDQRSSAAPAQPAALASFEADIAAAEKAEATRSQQAMQERILSSMVPKEQTKSKGANEEFLATNAASANGAPALTRQMEQQAAVVINEGHVIRSVLLTSISSDLPGRVLARVTSDVYDSKQRYIVIPKGSQLIGVYSNQVVIGQERLLIAMNRLILPNGSWVSLSGAGASDMTGMSGIKADVNNHFMKMFGSSVVLGAATLLLPRQDTTVSTLQSMGGTSSPGTAGSIFATSLNDVLKSLLERNRQMSPTLSLKQGDEFIFMVAQDIAMVPYKP